MSTGIGKLFGSLKGGLYALGAVIVGLFSAYWLGKNKGKDESEQKVQEAEQRAERTQATSNEIVEKVEKTNEVENEVNRLEPDSVAERLRNKWSRD